MTDDPKSFGTQPAKVEWYYIESEGVVAGPISEGSLQQAARSGQITQDTLIWQQDFDIWQAATSVHVTAVILGRDPNSIEPTAVRSRVEPPRPREVPQEAPEVTETQALADSPRDESPATETQALADSPKDESPANEVLQEAVTDEEAADPIIDFELAREIVDRAGGRSPRPTERSIPPSSVTWCPPPAGAQLVSLLGTPRLIGIAAVFLLSAAVALMLVRQSPSRTVQRSVSAPQQPEQPAVPKSTSESPTPSARNESGALETESDPVVAVNGPLKASLFLHHLKRSLPVFDEQCWDSMRAPGRQVEENPLVQIELAVDLTGRVYDVKSSDPPPGYRGAGRCIAGRIRGWKFPWAESGTRAVIVVKRAHD